MIMITTAMAVMVISCSLQVCVLTTLFTWPTHFSQIVVVATRG